MYCSPYKINGLIFLSRDTYILLCNLLRQLSNSSDRYIAGIFLASFSTLDYCLLPFDLGSHVYCLLFAFFCLMSVLTQIYLTPEPQPSSSQGHDHGYHSRLPSCFTLLLLVPPLRRRHRYGHKSTVFWSKVLWSEVWGLLI